MKLDLRFVFRPIEEIWSRILVGLVFEGSLNETEGMAALDAKTGGYLSRLQGTGFWRGARGETLLVASGGAVKAEKILLKGLGPRAGCNARRLSETLKEAGAAIDRMALADVAVHIPALPEERAGALVLETGCAALVGPFFRAHGGEDDFLLKIVVPVHPAWRHMGDDLLRRLRACFLPRMACSIIFTA